MGTRKRCEGLFKGKKGMDHEMFFNAFDLILAAVVLLALFSFVTSAVKLTLFEKHYLARDTSLLINTLYAAPHEVSYTYAEQFKAFSIDPSGQRVTLLDKGSKENPIWYPYAINVKQPISSTSSSSQDYVLTFSKKKTGLEIKAEPREEETRI